MIAWFQSHAGSIEANKHCEFCHRGIIGFNPTLVRLRRVSYHNAFRFVAQFQSHAGSIEAQLRISLTQ